MEQAKPKEKVKINVDGVEVEVPAGINAIEAAKYAKKEIPNYCYHSKLSIAGNCRICLIEIGMPMRDRATGEAILDDNGKPKIGWMPRPAIGCGTTVSPGLHIKTDSTLAKDCQNGVTEFLLVNHPLDCPVCDQAGECRLQEFSADYGRGESRFVENKVVKPKKVPVGPRVILDDERCILCSRCIRFCKEIIHEDVLGFTQRGSYTTLTCFPGKELSSNYSLNTVDICPVGALTSTDFRFKMRTWFLKQTKSICPESSVGVNTTVFSREGKIYRITPRQNDEVNDTWMSDSGRMLYKLVEAEDRMFNYRIDGHKVSRDEACSRINELMPMGDTAYVISGHMSVEEQFMLKKFTALYPGNVDAISHVGEGDELLISSDRTPNMRGAFVTRLLQQDPVTDLSHLAQQLDDKRITNIIVFNEDLTLYGITQAQLKKVNLIYFGTHKNPTSEVAKVSLPTAMVFEKSGTFVNQQFRLQKFHQAIPAPKGITSGDHLLCLILFNSPELHPYSVGSIWKDMVQSIPEFKSLAFEVIPDEGYLLDADAFQNFSFVEGKTLHYEPLVTTNT